MGPPEAASIASLLAWAMERLRAAGVAHPRREGLELWAAASGHEPGRVWTEAQAEARPDDRERLQLLVERRAAGEPLAYVLGWWEFRHLKLDVSSDVLIPRPETEGLVDLVLDHVGAGALADLGSGSGCLALALATEGRFDHVIGVDRSRKALEVAGRNARAAGAPVDWVLGDFGSMMAANVLDAVVSNPPYLSESEYARLDPSVRDFEPALALVSGPTGLEASERVLGDARRVLRPGGLLAMEIDSTRGAATAQLAVAAGFVAVAIHRDLFTRERYLLARRSVE